ncbi:hypothetical protein JD844_009107 [Phrynosoma platyrhinos]|uniref:Uncharacterized protein n=1 Tax=Phrynosoma platyrhinos TaxID=52577 RepID=A0ABQ7TER1_PHRPL|nr:hypothetical protein JD844_009107 [Phrynosoma platyrhinos]
MAVPEVSNTFSHSYMNPAFEGDIESDSPNKKNDITFRNRDLERGNSLHCEEVREHDASVNIEKDDRVNTYGPQDHVKPMSQRYLVKKYDAVLHFFKKHKTRIRLLLYATLIEAYLAMVIAACVLNFHRALPLFVLTVLGIFFICWDFLIAKYENRIAKSLFPVGKFLKKEWFWLKWVVWISLIAAIVCWLVFDTAKQGTKQLISFGGLVVYVLLMLIFSKYPTKVSVFGTSFSMFMLNVLFARH